jgi:DNA-binding NarL/FixJ family response regulator
MSSLVLVDDHDMMRRGLSSYFSQKPRWQVLGEAGSADEALTLFRSLAETDSPPDLVLLDIDLGEGWGPDLIGELKKLFPIRQPKAIIYSVFEDFVHLKAALKAGAAGYVCKSLPASDLEAAMEMVLAGGFSIPPHLAQKLTEVFDRASALTKRQYQVFELVQCRSSNKEISEALGISVRGVENNLSLIYDVMGVKSRAELEEL